MRIYHYGERGQFVGSAEADEDPCEHGRYLIPRNATTAEPPEIPDGKEVRFEPVENTIDTPAGPVTCNGMAWVIHDAPTVSQNEPLPISRRAEILAALQVLDLKSIRPLRENDVSRIAALDAQAAALRVELAGLAE